MQQTTSNCTRQRNFAFIRNTRAPVYGCACAPRTLTASNGRSRHSANVLLRSAPHIVYYFRLVICIYREIGVNYFLNNIRCETVFLLLKMWTSATKTRGMLVLNMLSVCASCDCHASWCSFDPLWSELISWQTRYNSARSVFPQINSFAAIFLHVRKSQSRSILIWTWAITEHIVDIIRIC